MGNSNSATPASSSSSAAIVSPQVVSPYHVELFFTTEAPGVKKGRLAAVDVNGNVLFKVHKHKNRRVMTDGAGNPLVSVKTKSLSVHDRREVFVGDSGKKDDLLFSVKRKSVFQIGMKLDVFMADNSKEKLCDYKIKGNFSKRTCTIYKGEWSQTVAQMNKLQKKGSSNSNLHLGKRGFRVSVNPNTDYAFIASLIFILHELHKEEKEAVQEALIETAVNVITS